MSKKSESLVLIDFNLNFYYGFDLEPMFLQFKEFELYWGAVFFLKICSHIFMIFEVKLEW